MGEAELFIRDQRLALGKHHKAALGCKDPFGHITSCLSLNWTGNQNMERQESRHLAAQEAQPGNRSLRADQSRTIAQQSYLEEAQKAARVAQAAGFWADGLLSFSYLQFPWFVVR